MNTATIVDIARSTLDGVLAFREAAEMLMEEGVEYYHVDLVKLSRSYYSNTGEVMVMPVCYEKLPGVASDFEIDLLRAAIIDSRRNGQLYRDFVRRAMRAGVQGYFVFLRGRRVTYWGRSGEQHTEWFPGAGPVDVPDIPLA